MLTTIIYTANIIYASIAIIGSVVIFFKLRSDDFQKEKMLVHKRWNKHYELKYTAIIVIITLLLPLISFFNPISSNLWIFHFMLQLFPWMGLALARKSYNNYKEHHNDIFLGAF